MERFGIHAAFNAGAIKWNDRYVVVARVESADRKSFFAVAESPNGVDNFQFWSRPVLMPEWGEPATNVYDMRLTRHEDGWIYGLFCVERKDHSNEADLSAATAACGIARTKDLVDWERLPDLKSSSQQRNVCLHPEFVDGKYALYTRPQDGFIDTGSGGGIGWALRDQGREDHKRTALPYDHRGQERRGSPPDQDGAGLASSGSWRKRLRQRSQIRALYVHDLSRRPFGGHSAAIRVFHCTGR